MHTEYYAKRPVSSIFIQRHTISPTGLSLSDQTTLPLSTLFLQPHASTLVIRHYQFYHSLNVLALEQCVYKIFCIHYYNIPLLIIYPHAFQYYYIIYL